MKLKALYLAVTLGCISICTLAQSPYTSTPKGDFQIQEKKGCEGFKVTVIAPDCKDPNVPDPGGTKKACNVKWGDIPNEQPVTFDPNAPHTYTTSGTYKLELLAGTNGFDNLTVEVVRDTLPEFEIYTCGANQVSVFVTDRNYNQYVIDFNDGNPVVVVPRGSTAKTMHTYTPGTHTISVRGRNLNAADNCTAASKQVTVLSSLPAPTINLLQVLNKDSIQLDFATQANIQYKLEIATNNSPTFQLYKIIYNTSSDILGNLKAEDNFYCFRLGAFDPCNNITTYSNTICSSNFDLSIQNNSNNLTWVTSNAGILDFRLNRTTTSGAFGRTITASPYSDTDIFCGTEYCYQLTTNYPNPTNHPGGIRSISLEKCGTAISTDIPGTIQNITAVVGDPGVQLQWQPITGFTPAEFSVFRSRNNTVLDLLSKTTSLQINDDSYRTENATCYIISYVDVCGNVSLLSNETCPIQLTGSIQRDNSIRLAWTSYTGWKDDVSEYVVEKYSMDGQLLQTFSPGLTLTLLDESQDDLINQTYRYIVKANAVEAGLPQAVSNPVILTKSANIFYPTAFTPNGDNLNDLFNVFGQYIVTFEMNIFNRWGELVFSSTALEQGWDGSFSGNPMPEGTYTFVADITDRAGRSIKKSGSVLLLRKR